MCYLCDDPVPDTIPGDPDTVSRFATAFSDTAEALRDAARQLGRLANENITISLAIDEVRERADDVKADTDRVADRYAGAASTFSSYATALSSARSTGNGARNQIIANNDSGRYWRHRLRDLEQQRAWGNNDAELLADIAEAIPKAAYYDGHYGTYLGNYSSAVQDRDAAVNAAIAGLAEAEQNSGLNDGWFDGILGDWQQIWALMSKYLGPVLELLREVMEVLKKIVDVLALILTIASFIFPALGPLALALSALSVILSIAIFACSLILFAMGRESIGRVISDGISAVAGVLLSKLGGGSVLGNLKGAFSGFQAFGMATRTTLLAVGTEGVETLGQAVAGEAVDSAIGGTVSAGLAPMEFLWDQMDFEIGAGQPWGEPDRPNATTDLLLGISDSATFGTTTTAADGFDLFQLETWTGIGDEGAEVFDTWGSIGAVPAT